jgi:hypothetical protein
MKHIAESGEVWYGLHEVYYNKKNQIWAWTEDPVDVTGDTVDELEQALTTMLTDVTRSKKDVLDFDMEPEGDI